jgi:nitroreductase/dihydropteridine reductase
MQNSCIMRLIESLLWRYATKKFNPAKIVDAKNLAFLKEVIRLSASSYGLQPFKVKIVDDKALKNKLRLASYGQSQISDCSHLFIFSHLTAVPPNYIDNYMELVSTEREIDKAQAEGYSAFMKRTLGEFSQDDINNWASKQAYIGMTNLLTACAELKIDTCPIEGFDAKAYNTILELDDLSLSACVVVAVGYRDEHDETQHLKKVRLAAEELFI